MPSIEVFTAETPTEAVTVTPTSEIYYQLAAKLREAGSDTQQPLEDILQHRRIADSLYTEAEMFAENERRIKEGSVEHSTTFESNHSNTPHPLGRSAVRRLIGGFFER